MAIRTRLLSALALCVALAPHPGCKSGDGAALRELRDEPPADRDLAAPAAGVAPAARPPRLRRSIFDPAARADVEAYALAVKTLQSTPQGKAVWEGLASIHQNFCPHRNWFFLPWHRVYLDHFENVIAKVSGKADFALPYWEWDGPGQNRMPPEALAGGGLFWQRRSTAARSPAGRLLPQNVGEAPMRLIMDANDFIQIGSGRATQPRDPHQTSEGLIESMPHDSTHVWVGGQTGDMVSFLSPRDPIFWMHHCNIDRLWSSWMKKQTALGRAIIPTAGAPFEVKTQAWLDFGLQSGFQEIDPASAVPTLRAAQRSYKVSETFDSVGTFGFDYDKFRGGGAASASLTDELALKPVLKAMKLRVEYTEP